MFHDFILNDQLSGPISEQLGMPGQLRFDPGFLRPFLNDHNVKCVTINTGRMVFDAKVGKSSPQLKTFAVRALQDMGLDVPVFNTTTTLRKDQWVEMDRRMVEVQRPRLVFWNELMRRAPYSGFNAWARMTLEYQAISHESEALMSLDGLTEGRQSDPVYSTRSMPLPIIHSDFRMSSRTLAISRNGGGPPLDMSQLDAASIAIAEKVEKVAIGVEDGVEYGTVSTGPYAHDGQSRIYGPMNFPFRTVKTDLTAPTLTNPQAVVDDILDMRETLYAANHFGPFMIFHSTDWDRYLDDDYAFTDGTNWGVNPTMTLRERILKIQGIQGLIRLDHLTAADNPFTLIMMQMTSDQIEAVNGMDPTIVQWTEKGGMDVRFKVMCIRLPRMKRDFNDSSAVIVATTS